MSSTKGFLIVTLVILALGVSLCSLCAAEEEEAAPAARRWKAGADLAVHSEYIWRGLEKYQTAVEPGVYVEFPSFRVEISGVAETGGDSAGEVTPSFEYFFSWGELNFSAGYIFYGHDHDLYANTSELFGTVSWDTGTPFCPWLRAYWDIDEADALYARFGISYVDSIEEIDFGLDVSLGAATDGFGETYFGVKEGGIVDFDAFFSMNIPFARQMSFEPFVGLSYLVDSSLKRYVEDDANAYGGAALHLVF